MAEIRDTRPVNGRSPLAERVTAFAAELADLRNGRELSDAERVDVIRALEELKGTAAAEQAQHTVDLDVSTRAHHAELKLPKAQHGRGVAQQVALARRESPFRGGMHLGMAKALVTEMPHTLALLSRGVLSEFKAMLLVKETACLSREARQAIDAELSTDPATLDGLGIKRLVAEVRRRAARLEPEALVRRAAKATKDRRVTLRPAPDTMVYLTALLPVQQGVAAYAALAKAADTARPAGDDRCRGQVMADTLIERLTGQATAGDVGVEVDLVITDRALLDPDGPGGQEPAFIPGYGIVPAGWARGLLSDTMARAERAADKAATVALRRLFTHPTTGQLVALEAHSRAFPPGLSKFVRTRDAGICRNPYCDAPVRHADHAVSHAAGGETSAAGGQGLCEACNYAKQGPGWRARPSPTSRLGDHEVQTTTPTGHTCRSKAPPLPGAGEPTAVAGQVGRSRFEIHFTDYLTEYTLAT